MICCFTSAFRLARLEAGVVVVVVVGGGDVDVVVGSYGGRMTSDGISMHDVVTLVGGVVGAADVELTLEQCRTVFQNVRSESRLKWGGAVRSGAGRGLAFSSHYGHSV